MTSSSEPNFSQALWNAAIYRDGDTMRKLISAHANVKIKAENGFDNYTPLHWAAKKGNVELCSLLLESGLNIDEKSSEYSLTALNEAAASGQFEAVEFLIENKAQIEGRDNRFGFTSLLWAARHGHVDCVNSLLDYEADIDAKDHKHGKTALHLAASQNHSEVIEVLSNRGADVNATDTKVGNTALLDAASGGKYEAVESLIQNGADVNYQNKSGNTALHLASWFGHPHVIYLLIQYESRMDLKNKLDRTAADTAKASNQISSESIRQMIISMLNAADMVIGLHEATKGGRSKEVKKLSRLLEGGVDIMLDVQYENTDESDKFSPVHEAADNGDCKTLQVLLDNGADVDIQTPEWGYTPLHRAVLQDHLSAVKMLLEEGAETEICDYKNDATALHLACINSFDESVKLLLENLARPDVFDRMGETPAHKTITEDHYSTLKVMLKNGISTEIRNRDNRTLLQEAIRLKNYEKIKLLVGYGAKLMAVTHHKNNALHMAATSGNTQIMKLFIDQIFPFSFNKLNYQNEQGNTPLHIAASYGHVKMVELLLCHGVQLTITNRRQQTPLEAAEFATPANQRKIATMISKALKAQETVLLQAACQLVARQQSSQWTVMAKKLGILTQHIRMIQHNHPDAQKQCYEMLAMWQLRNHSSPDIFYQLLGVVKRWGGNQKLTDNILKKYREIMVQRLHKIKLF